MDHEFKSRQFSTGFPPSRVIISSVQSSGSKPHPATLPFSNQFDSEANQSLANLIPNSNDNNPSASQVPYSSTTPDATSASPTVPPHLKRRHGHKHMRQQLHSARASSQIPNPLLSTDTALPTPNQQANATQASPSRVTQLQINRSNTVPSPKRPPASHSSYGVETIAGPPPSFDTRRTLSQQEKVWRIDRSKSLRMTIGSDRTDTSSQSQNQTVPVASKDSGVIKSSNPATPLLTQSSPDTTDTQSILTPTDAEEGPNMEMRSDHGLGVSNSEGGSKTSSESHKSEDLFLNIARVDAGRPNSSKGEKRRSRVSLPFFSARPATSYNPEGIHLQADPIVTTPRAGVPSHHIKRASLQFAQTHGVDQTSEHGSTDASNSGQYSKRSSTLYADTIRPPQRSTTGLRNHRLVSEGGYLDRPRFSEQNATESTASTTAPSTVWDELDDLKSRIRKLELTGKLPPSSAAAMSSAERPRTATTAATTMSSSPKHNKVANTLQSTVEGIPSSTHPLLHEALGNAQGILSHEVYQKLQATAQDALQLTSFTNLDIQSDRSAVPFATDRQLRRRTESLCRNLTELAIALATESKSAQTVYRPGSREYHPSSSASLRTRRYSNEPMDRPPVSNRVASRLETRKTSMQVAYSNPRRISTDLESPSGASQYPGSGTRNPRASTAYHARRAPSFLDGANDEEQNSPSVRPISRAMTEVSAARRLSRDHAAASREYTRHHPMPTQMDSPLTKRTPLPSHLSTNFTSRRKHPSPSSVTMADSSPLASRPSWGRISVIQQDAMTPSDTVSEAPGSSRSVTTRRSFGLASRIGSSVGNRLRSAKSERVESRTFKDSPTARDEENGNSEGALHEQQY